MALMPFAGPLDVPVRSVAAGEKQKLEILKQLYLGRRFLILDEPTSVLTSDKADEVLGHAELKAPAAREGVVGAPVLELTVAGAHDRLGLREIAGIAGISGIGQTELMDLLTGQRPLEAGEVVVEGTPDHATRSEARVKCVRYLPEELLQNASVGRM